MRRVIDDTSPEGLDALLGERVTLWCTNYIYTGKLVGVNDTFVKLSDAAVVYETGPLDSKTWADSQKLPNDWYVMRAAVESFGKLK